MTDEQKNETNNNNIAVVKTLLPEFLPIIALKERPIFPGITHSLIITMKEQKELVHKIFKSPRPFLGMTLLTQSLSDHLGQERSMKTSDLAGVGVIGRISQMGVTPGGALHVTVTTLSRFEILEFTKETIPFYAKVKYWEVDQAENKNFDDEQKAIAISIINTIRELIQLGPVFKDELTLLIGKGGAHDLEVLANYAPLLTTASKEELQSVLEIKDLKERLENSLILLKRELEITKTQNKINEKIEENVGRDQKKFFLKQQLAEIQKELGMNKDAKGNDAEKFRIKLDALKAKSEIREKIEEEINKLQMLESASPEYGVTRSYIDWLTSLPWDYKTDDQLDLEVAKTILDQEHFGLKDIKERILEFLAVAKIKGGLKGNIILLSGPPGVGKTSIGKSIAKALGRKFYRFSLGGMRDEAEIKGHRRTYVAALPGKFIQAIKSTGTSNPVILLDEIDKMGRSFQGDPGSALLEVLDPEQNKDFLDHYLDIKYDLSDVLFICTANQLENIPAALLDRMETITLSGYSSKEKIEIAKNHLLPKILKDFNIDDKVTGILSEEILAKIIEDYARESGVRSLEQVMKKLVRKLIFKANQETINLQITQEQLKEFLGLPRFREDSYYHEPHVGVVTGLAYTSMGGDTLNIEAVKIPGQKGDLKLTGQLGEVMQESANIALSYVRLFLGEKQEEQDFLKNNGIHLHVPAGATPKDGPSAGVTIASAFYSLIKNKNIKSDLAMTGELTLTGHVMPIGGVKEKTLAAKRAKMKEIILPLANRPDFEKLDDDIKNGISVHFVKSFPEVVDLAFA